MKNIFYILLLLPTFIFAQYPSNSGHKITLGEQTTADGLVWRGLRADTTSKIVPLSDTSAYIILDTVEKTLWLYKAGQVPKWQQVGGSTLDTATMLLPYYRAGRNTIIQAADVPTLNQNTTGSAATLTTGRTIQTNLASTSAATFNGSANITPGVTGTLPVANGGTNTSTAFTAGSVVFAGASGTYSQDNSNLFWNNTNKRLGIGTTSPLGNLDISTSGNTTINITAGSTGLSRFIFGTISGDNRGFIDYDNTSSVRAMIFKTNENEAMRITSGGEVWIGYTTDQGAYPLQVNGQIFATNATIATSDEKFKENITPLSKGLEIVSKLKPVTFNFINDTENNFSEYEEVGFIAQDVDRALSNETFSKSIVKSANDSEPTSTMGLATQNLIPILVKAIQEQQALIKALEQRIINLENK